MFGKLLIPTDFSEWSDTALELLRPLKQVGSREALLLHVMESGPYLAAPEAFFANQWERLKEHARAEMQARQARAQEAGLAVEARIVEGGRTETIVHTAAAEKADLIVMGARQRGFLQHIVLGSTTENVMRLAPVPVLLVKGPAGRQPAPGDRLFEHLLFPTDFSVCAEKALDYVIALARAGTRRITLLHVRETRGHPFAESAEETERLHHYRETLEALGAETRVILREGVPFREILRIAGEGEVTAIVQGSHGKNAMVEVLLGSVSAVVTRRAHLPVLIVRCRIEK